MISHAELLQEFEKIKDKLKSYVLRITASPSDTEDIIHDTFIKAHDKLSTFKEESTLKTWLFAIASNLAKDNLRTKKRWSVHVTDMGKEAARYNPEFFRSAMNIQNNSTQGAFEIR